MAKKLTPDDFWDSVSIETDRGYFTDFFPCPKCGALIKDVPLHINFHRELGDG